MILEAIETSIVGVVFLSGYLTKVIISKKQKNKLLPNGVYSYSNPHRFTCPQCDTPWINKSIKFCECDEFYSGHFHVKCLGKESSSHKDIGCGYKWIIAGKNS